ncbi:MAG: SpoIID/LytB domain-containing protein, partial [bacterium]
GIIINNTGYEERVFYGNLEVQKINNQYILVSEVTIENYISSTIAGNLNSLNINTSTDNLEFLKTLAVILRTNMIYHIYQNDFQEVGVNISDTYQLYNYTPTLDLHQQASIQTMGEIISSNKLNYFTFFEYSNGMTANSGEIWGHEDYFYYPTENKEFLDSKNFVDDVDLIDISSNLNDEVNANIFFKSKEVLSVEASSEWFRWSVTLDKYDLDNINQEIITLSSNDDYKYYIKFLENNNKYNYYISNYKNNIINIQDIGTIKDVRVLERGEGGNIIKLEIAGELESVRVETDELIKSLFKSNHIINNNGDILDLEGLTSLPSSCFVFDKIYDSDLNLVELTIYGGGYGHGVGLSLYGASKLSEELYLYEEILELYYNNIKISNLNNL